MNHYPHIAARALFSLVVALVLLPLDRASAFDWDYSETKFDLTFPAVMGSSKDFEQWKTAPLNYLRAHFESAITSDPVIVSVSDPIKRDGYTITHVDLLFKGVGKRNSDLHYVAALAKPIISRPLPAIVAINGHGEVGGEGKGQAPASLFQDGGHGDYLAKNGFTVIALPNTIHEPFSELAKTTDYSIIWARLADKALTALRPLLPDGKLVAAGNAAGGLTSLVLTIMRDDIVAISNNGAFFSLEHTRRDYRIYPHPFCHDFRAFFTYASVYALLAPKPLLIQQGESDSLWLGSGPKPASDWYSGSKRSAISDETIGAFLMLREIWNREKSTIELKIHHAGHEDFNANEFISFIMQIKNNWSK